MPAPACDRNGPHLQAVSNHRHWEGTGVAPDIEVGADEALDEVRRLAAEAIKGRSFGAQ